MFPGNFLPPRLTSDTRRNCVKMLEMRTWVFLHFPSCGSLQNGPNDTIWSTLFRMYLCTNYYNIEISVKICRGWCTSWPEKKWKKWACMRQLTISIYLVCLRVTTAHWYCNYCLWKVYLREGQMNRTAQSNTFCLGKDSMDMASPFIWSHLPSWHSLNWKLWEYFYASTVKSRPESADLGHVCVVWASKY